MPAFYGLDKALRWIRLQSKRKQREVAQAAGITQAMLCAYEQGKRTPSLASLEKILDTLQADLTQLSHALHLVNQEPGAPAPARDQVGSPYPHPAPAPADVAEPTVDLYQVLGTREPLPPEQEAALEELLDGFCRWLRLLHTTAPRPQGNAAKEGER